MRESLVLRQGSFGHLSILNTASGIVTHAHRDAQVVLWIAGRTGDMTVNGLKVRPSVDRVVCTNSYEPHSHNLPQDSGVGRLAALYINPNWVRGRYGIAADAPLFPTPAIPVTRELRAAADVLLDAPTQDCSPGPDHLRDIERFIDRLMEAIEADRPENGQSMRVVAMNDFRIRRATALMQENVTKRIRFDQLARSVGLSRPHFFMRFKEQLNVTPNVYWNALRVEEACRRLREVDGSVTTVASVLGFTTEGNFCRFFRDHIGVPPTVYRSAAHLVGSGEAGSEHRTSLS